MRYTWECLKCGKETLVARSLKDYEKPPFFDCNCGEKAKWRKIITASAIQGNLQKGNYNSKGG